MIDLGEMAEPVNNALAEGNVCLVGTASSSGEPDIAFKGSVMVFDQDHLAYWERSKGQSLQNLQDNPQACVLYRSRERGVAWRFYGAAEIHADGALRQQIMDRTVQAELDRDPERGGVAVLIRVDRIVAGRNVIQSREEVASAG
ncbi:MAG: pyridoxamine 5'-phosphate oxidase family protein [Dehalococcoidia bacterium]